MGLTKEQIVAAALMADGMPYPKIGKKIGMSRSTIARWAALEEFQAEVAKRKTAAADAIGQKLDEIAEKQADDLFATIKEYREARTNIYKQKLARGLKGLKKITERFDDLPAESIAPSNIAQLMNSFDGLIESAMNGWAELIGIDEILKRLEDAEQKRD